MQIKAPFLFYLLAFSSALVAGFTISGCTPVVSQHGNMVQPYQFEQIEEGRSTRSDVLRAIGSPTTQSTFNPDVWYYIGQEAEKYGILDHDITQEHILVVTFNEDGIVETIAPFDNNRKEIPYAKGKTPTHGNNLTLMQQLLGNLGKFNSTDTSATDY